MMPPIRTLLALTLTGALTGAMAPALAQSFPNKPIRLVVSYPAGGGVDFMARVMVPSLAQRLGQPVIVENRSGAGGGVGTAFVAKAPADGYTVLVGSGPSITMNPHLQPVPYDPFKDLIGLVKAVTVPTVITVAGDSPYKSLKELLDAARAQPGRLSYGTPGNGSNMHIELEMLKERAGVDFQHVPYKGAPPIIADTMGGQITVGAPGLPPTVGNIRAGKLRLLAVWGTRRASIFPDVPTVKEALGGTLDPLPTWYGYMLPGGTPPAVVARLEAAFVETLAEPDVVKRLADSGAEVVAETTTKFDAANRAESATFAALFKKLNIKAE